MADENTPAFYPRVGNITPKPRTPLAQTEVREQPLDPVMRTFKDLMDRSSALLDKSKATPFDVTKGLIGAIPFHGERFAKDFDQSTMPVPTGFGLLPTASPEGLDTSGMGMQSVRVPTKDALNEMKWSDLVGTAGASRMFEALGQNRTPEFFDTLDAATIGLGGLGAARAAPKVAKAVGEGAKAAGMGGLEMIDRGMFGEGPLRKLVPQHQFAVSPKKGSVSISNNPDTMMMELGNKEPMKASEALGKIEGRPLLITQADRTKVGGGFLGGPGFSGLQLTDPAYRAAEAAWAVKNPGTANTILGGNRAAGKDAVFAAMLGSPTQHQSNQMVFDKMYGEFKKAAKRGELEPELRDKINMRLASAVDKEGNPVFPADIDILDKNFKKIADTFDRRSIAGHLMGGVQVGGKKGQIIDYDKIIKSTTDPLLVDAPSGAIGNRLFTLSGGVIDRPDLHPAFPTILQGEDLGVSFDPVTRDLIMKDFIEKTQREKGRAPGYMDYTRGYPPSQLITEDLLTELQKLGKKKGGAVHKAQGGAITGDDLILEERPL
jgi:hypothetical protein